MEIEYIIGNIIGIIFVIIAVPAIILMPIRISKLADEPLVITREITFHFKSDEESKTDEEKKD